jgi:Na+/proline symporter
LIRFFRVSSKVRKKLYRIGVLGLFIVLALYILVTFLFRSYSSSESEPSEGTSSIILPAGAQLALHGIPEDFRPAADAANAA